MLPDPSFDSQRGSRRHLLVIASIALLTLTAIGPIAESNTIDAVSWDRDQAGRLVVSITCTETVKNSSYRAYQIPDPPRIVLVVEGITEPVKPGVLTISDPFVRQLRLGHHADSSPPELHVILDLTDEDPQILDLSGEGERITLSIGDPERPTTSPTPAPSPTPTPFPSPSSTPSPIPAPPTATSTPSPSETPDFPDRPAPPVPPATEMIPSPVRISATPAPTAPLVFSSPTPVAEPIIATRVVDITSSVRTDGSTLLRISADGRLPQGCARYLETTDDPPRIVLTIRGLSAPELPRTIEIGDVNIDRVRLIHDVETPKGELHLLIQPARDGISVADLKQVGRHLVLQLVAADPASTEG